MKRPVFCSQAIVVAVDAKAVNPENTRWEIFTHGGRKSDRFGCGGMGRRNAAAPRAGEILLTQYGPGRYQARF